jgi:iron(III) transport system substrate-binding protein
MENALLPRRSTRLAAVVIAASMAGFGLAGCSNDSSRTADDKTITVYSGRSEELVAPILAAFTEETGIAVEARYGDSAELAAQLIEEGDGSPADVFFAQDAGALGSVSNEELLGVLPADTLEGIPAEYRSTKGDWTGVTGRARVIAFDSEAVDAADVPDSVFDLTDPQYKGEVAIAPTNASFQSFVTAMRVSEGEEVTQKWLEDMVANDVQKYDRNGLILDAVDSGEVTYGLINHYYWFEKADELGADTLNAQLSFTEAGDPGSLVNVAGVGVLEGSIDDPDTLAFVEFLLSQETQELFVEETSEYALLPGVEQVEGLTTLDELQGPDVDLADLSSLPQTLELLQEVGLT